MNKRSIATVLLASVLFTSCAKAPEVTEEATTAEQTTTTTTTEATTTTSRTTTTTTTGVNSEVAAEFQGLVPGDIFTFGEYEGDELNWIVLSKTLNIIYCVCEESVTFLPYDEDNNNEDWNESTLSIWLNDDFYNAAFTDEEKVRIKYASDTSYPAVSQDNKIYLLNRSDFSAYSVILDDHELSRGWWLRSHSNTVTDAADIITSSGDISYDGCSCRTPNGVRPAMKIYTGTDPDRLDLSNLEPTPTPTPTPAPTPVPEPDPVAVITPSEMPYDTSASEEANLEAYYTNNIAGLYGTAPANPSSTGPDRIMYPYPTWLDIPGALAHSISDFDGDGDLEMIAFVFVAELDEEQIEDSDRIFYRMHLLLCDDVDGTVKMLQDLPVMSWYSNSDGQYGTSLYAYHTGVYNDPCYHLNISLYQINRDNRTYIMMTEELNANPSGDGFTEAAFIWEVSDNTIMYSSSYCAGAGSDDTAADEITFENGIPVSDATYYMYPDEHNAPGMVQGIEYYFDRQGLAHNDYDVNYGTVVTDESAPLIADISIVPVEESDGQSSGSWTFNYEVQIGVG